MHCTPFISPTLTVESVTLHELKPIKQQIHYKNNYKQIDARIDELMIMIIFSQLHPESVKLVLKHKTH